MKNIKLYFFLFLVLFSACQKNEDVLTKDEILMPPILVPGIEMDLQGFVYEPNSLFKWNQNYIELHNVEVKLMFKGEVLDQTNTDGKGYYSFPTQVTPVEGAYLVFSANGYYPNVLKVDTFGSTFQTRYLLRENFEYVAEEALSSEEDFITIKGHLQNPTDGGGVTFFMTNARGEMIGNYTSDANLEFEFTTLPDEELFLQYKFRCAVSDPIPLGSFSEDTDVGVLLDQSYDFSNEEVVGAVISDDCDGGSTEGYVLITRNNSTIHTQIENQYSEEKCILEGDDLAYVTYVSTSSRKYGNELINYNGGQALDLSISMCEEDDTYFLYSVGGSDLIDPEVYTFADVLPDGRTILKQVDPTFFGEVFITFELEGSTPGNMIGAVRFYGFQGIHLGGENLSVEVTLNDGAFIEGTVSGEVFNPFEVSRGALEGMFRARIH